MSNTEEEEEIVKTDNAPKSSCPHSNWSKDKLTGKSVSFKGLPAGSVDTSVDIVDATTAAASPGGNGRRMSLTKRRSNKSMTMAAPADEGIDPQLWGRPGHLSDSEADTYVSFDFIFYYLLN